MLSARHMIADFISNESSICYFIYIFTIFVDPNSDEGFCGVCALRDTGNVDGQVDLWVCFL